MLQLRKINYTVYYLLFKVINLPPI